MSDYSLWFEGILFSEKLHTCEILREVQDNFVVKDEDIITVTYPKSETHWCLEILCLMHSKGDPKWIQSVPCWECSPWIEMIRGYKSVKDQKGPCICSSHLPVQLFPKSFFSSKAKLIYGIRNPRDILVSGYYFLKQMKVFKNPEMLEKYMELFLQGNVLYGSWFEYVHGWLSMKERENVLVLSYEELMKDARSTVEKICQFLGKKLKPEEIDLVIQYSSFQVMKENQIFSSSLFHDLGVTEGFTYMRKGIIGDWKNHFTVAQAEDFDKIYQEKMAGYTPKMFPWESF